jgi:hypothetical protein
MFQGSCERKNRVDIIYDSKVIAVSVKAVRETMSQKCINSKIKFETLKNAIRV